MVLALGGGGVDTSFGPGSGGISPAPYPQPHLTEREGGGALIQASTNLHSQTVALPREGYNNPGKVVLGGRNIMPGIKLELL